MNVRTGLMTALLSVVLSAGAVADDKRGDKHEKDKLTGQAKASLQQIKDWPEVSQRAAKDMVQKYGEPDETTDTLWIWYDNGDWKRTVLSSKPIEHKFPKPHQDVLLQTINYDVPVDKFDELAEYDGSVIAERTAGELSARCDREEANYLALNLAHEIIEGNKSVQQARTEYGEAIKSFMQDETPKTMKSFAFRTPRRNTEDPDKAIIQVAGR